MASKQKKIHRIEMHCLFYCGILLSLIFISFTLKAQHTERRISDRYEELKVKIPMRDGIQLNTEIYIPKRKVPKYKNAPLPILFYRTPYGIYRTQDGQNYHIKYIFTALDEEDYIFVFQDIRGRFESEGSFLFDRPPRDREDPNAIDEGTDAYDTVQWLLANLPGNNGRVGMIGDSYSGWLVLQSLIEPHPAIKTTVILGPNADYWIGDDLFHYGAFRLSMSFEFTYMLENSRTNDMFPFGGADVYDWFLTLGPLSNVNKNYYFGGYPTWNDLMSHPNYDDFWKKHAVVTHLKKTSVPTLFVAGFWDTVDLYGPLKVYEILEQNDSQNTNFLVIGPWLHGDWWIGYGNGIGPLEFGMETTTYYKNNIELPWLAYYLKDRGQMDLAEATVFLSGENVWQQFDLWPPVENIEEKNLYFRKNGRLSFNPPETVGSEVYVSYTSDPADPVPYTERPIKGFLQGSFDKWKVEDQRFLDNRRDVVSWMSDTLETDVTISGRIFADFYASTDGTDCDWIVKLIDVFPEEELSSPYSGDYQFMIADEVMRAKFRNSFEDPSPLIPQKITHFQIDLNSRNHCFRKGHRIMVQMQSTWFPLIDRNPHVFLDIPNASEKDYHPALQKIYFTKDYPSHIKLPVVK